MIEAVEATRESKADAKNEEEEIRLWLDALTLADKEEEHWRKRAEQTVEIYRQNDKKRGDGETIADRDRKFNILHANIETLLPALYNSTPIPDVRRRYDDKNPVAKVVVDVLERGLSYSIDSYDFDETMRYGVSDMELTGRGVTRVRYQPYLGQDESLAYEEVLCEHVPWKHFRRGPARTWPEVPWIAFELFLTREELVKLSPEHGKHVKLDASMQGADEKRDGENPPDVFKRAKVWEIWDKDNREILFIAESYKEHVIRRESDPLELMGFFPIPRPLYAIQTSDSLIPVVPYEIYRDQAEELERVSQRIMALTEACKARGAYDARATEISKLADGDDNQLVPIESVAVFADGSDLEKKILYWPLETIVKALEQLYLARDQIKQTIYEVTGIADILRGNTDPNETLGAQELKAQWGSLRIQRMQAEIARYARDLFRLKAEIMATKFDPNTLQLMTGIPLVPSPEEPPEQAQQKQQVLALLKNDALRGFNVDIESDSTIRADLTRKQQNMNLFLQGTAQFASAMGPIVMAPQFQSLSPAVIEIYSAFARNFKLGKQAEDALDAVADQARQMAANPQPQQEDPAVQVEKLKAQNEAQKMQMEMAFKKEEHQMKLQMMQADLQKKEMELQFKERELGLKAQEIQMQAQAKENEIAMKAEAQQAETAMHLEATQRENEMAAEAGERKHKLGMEALEAKTEAQIKAAKAKPQQQKKKAA